MNFDFFLSLSPLYPFLHAVFGVVVQILNSVGVTAGRFVLLNDNEVRHEVKLLNTERSLWTTSRRFGERSPCLR